MNQVTASNSFVFVYSRNVHDISNFKQFCVLIFRLFASLGICIPGIIFSLKMHADKVICQRMTLDVVRLQNDASLLLFRCQKKC